MKQQELIERIEGLKKLFGNKSEYIEIDTVIRLISELDELEKVTIPQFVADWYEENKDDFEFNVWNWIAFGNEPEKLENKEFNSWINDSEGNPIQTLVNMHQFGYEVEKEKRYLVKLKNNSEYVDYLVDTEGNGFRFYSNIYTKRREHTRKELEEAGFAWVFSCEGIEVEEVE